MAKKILSCKLMQNNKGEIYGPVAHSVDSIAVLEAIYSIIVSLSVSAEVPAEEIAADLLKLAKGKVV